MATREGKPTRRPICRTPEEAFQAGQQLVRDMGWKLSPAARARCLAITLPFVDRIREAQEAAAAERNAS